MLMLTIWIFTHGLCIGVEKEKQMMTFCENTQNFRLDSGLWRIFVALARRGTSSRARNPRRSPPLAAVASTTASVISGTTRSRIDTAKYEQVMIELKKLLWAKKEIGLPPLPLWSPCKVWTSVDWLRRWLWAKAEIGAMARNLHCSLWPATVASTTASVISDTTRSRIDAAVRTSDDRFKKVALGEGRSARGPGISASHGRWPPWPPLHQHLCDQRHHTLQDRHCKVWT